MGETRERVNKREYHTKGGVLTIESIFRGTGKKADIILELMEKGAHMGDKSSFSITSPSGEV